ncbi:MAG: hypothetical protein PHC84_01720 [Clostridia bacterium]|nr:hypothetical protein [Clostridia bacterium]
MRLRNPIVLSQKSIRIIRISINAFVALALILSLTVFIFSKTKSPETVEGKVIALSDVKNIPDESLYIEWLGSSGYNVDNPTMILFHGETPGNWDSKFSMTLPETDYVYYSSNSTTYNVTRNIDIERTLHQYWLSQNYNVGIFHWEKFADDNMDKLVKKLYNAVDMRYKTATDTFENNAVPNYSLTEIASAVYLDEIPDEAYGREIRLVGNGVGAILALSVSDYLYDGYSEGLVRQEVLPHRVSLIDPYLSPEGFETDTRWRSIASSNGTLGMALDMLEFVTPKGLVAEMVENVEVGAKLVGTESQETLTPPYDYTLSAPQHTLKNELKSNTAYLLLRQKYSEGFYTENYRKQNRAGLDWYLYSVRGSDDPQMGYPDQAPDYSSSYCNWGRNNTRPILNDRQRNDSSSRGKNYAVGAWTETVWIRALKGIEFRMQKFSDYLEDDEGNVIKDIHGISLYTYNDYHIERFRGENYQRATNMDKTVVAGYVFNDKNEDRVMNEGISSYLSGVTINVTVTTSVDGQTETVESFTTQTGNDGFYLITFERAFMNAHSVTLTVVPPDSSFHVQTAGLTTYHVADLTKHTFIKNTKTLSISNSYANAITFANCGVVIK